MARGRKPKETPPIGAPQLNRLDSLLPRIESAKATSDDARSDIGNVYKEAEDFGFHRKALKEAVRLRNMEPQKRNDYLSSLQAYCDYLKVWSQGNLFGEEPKVPQPPESSAEAAVGPEPAEEQSQVGTYNYESGRRAGHEGKGADENPWASSLPIHNTWEAGRQRGGQEVEDGLVDRPTAEETEAEDAPASSNGAKRNRRHKTESADAVV